MKLILSLIKIDLKNITRDFLNTMMFVAAILAGLMMRLLLPFLNEYFANYINLESYYLFASGFIIIFPPILYGFVVGFLILDERDENLISYFAITPLTKKGYIYYRIICPIIFSFLFTLITLYIASLVEIKLARVLPAIALASMQTPLIAIFMSSFAENKLEGMAVGKFYSISNFSSFAVIMGQNNLKYIAGIFPQFWVTETFVRGYNQEGGFLTFIIGLLITFVWMFLLYRIFIKKIN